MKSHLSWQRDVPSQKRPVLSRLIISTSLALGMLSLSLALGPLTSFDLGGTAWAGPGNGYGSGDNNGGGNAGAGQGGDKGNGGPPLNKGDLYGDMVYLQRDADGVPVLDDMDCMRPLAIGGSWTAEDEQLLPLYWEFGYQPQTEDLPEDMANFCYDEPVTTAATYRLMVQERSRLKLHKYTSPVTLAEDEESEPEACDVVAVCADDMTEVDLGRLSVLRSPAKVLDRQRDEAIRDIQRATMVWLDEGGRLVVDGATLDSPLINLALMREFLSWGELYVRDKDLGQVTVWGPPESFGPQYTPELAAAFGLGAGDDKLGAGVDPEVAVRSYLITGIPEMTDYLDTIALDSELYNPDLYLDLETNGFSYNRASVFPGGLCWDSFNGDSYVRHFDTIMGEIFNHEPFTATGLAAFAQAAEDARKVMVFTHDNLVYFIDRVFSSNYDGLGHDSTYCPTLGP